MSVVGPRPHMLSHTQYYSRVIHNFMDRHKVKPGITGLAQIAGHRGETKEVECMDKRVKADLHYIENWSFMLDMKIILLTLLALFRNNDNAF